MNFIRTISGKFFLPHEQEALNDKLNENKIETKPTNCSESAKICKCLTI